MGRCRHREDHRTGRIAPSKNAVIVAALEDWARNVLANHPDAAEATVGVLTNNNTFTPADLDSLRETLERLDLADLIDALDPGHVPYSEETARRR